MSHPDESATMARLRQFLDTDPRDVACERAMELLHVYVELKVAGQDPEEHYPGIAVHLRACGPCSDEYKGLLAAVTERWP